MLKLFSIIESFFKSNLGLDFRRLLASIFQVPWYVMCLWKFKLKYDGNLHLTPYLHDWKEDGGTATGEYFLQDLYVARKINKVHPNKHIDVGSRVDGFISNVASFMEVEVLDIRVIKSKVEGIKFKQVDMMNPLPNEMIGYSDSVSCLHALEHFGLGRYGDPIDVNGHINGFRNLALMLKEGGIIYISLPVGQERVQFNGQRILNPNKFVSFGKSFGLNLIGFAYIQGDDEIVESNDMENDINKLSNLKYSLGIFTFKK